MFRGSAARIVLKNKRKYKKYINSENSMLCIKKIINIKKLKEKKQIVVYKIH